jgi:hypothetical protein
VQVAQQVWVVAAEVAVLVARQRAQRRQEPQQLA